jgi:hypothetical protein
MVLLECLAVQPDALRAAISLPEAKPINLLKFPPLSLAGTPTGASRRDCGLGAPVSSIESQHMAVYCRYVSSGGKTSAPPLVLDRAGRLPVSLRGL